MTRPLTPRVPRPEDSARPHMLLAPRVALAAALGATVLSALLGLVFGPVQLPATVQVAAARYSVQMANYAFAPASITVNEGDTITWTNQDTAPHTVTTTSGPQSLNSPYLSKGQSWSYTFSAPGTYEYYCTVHPDMRARVIVRAAAPATTAARTQNPYTARSPRAAAPAAAPTQTARPSTAAQATTNPAASAAVFPPGGDPSASGATDSQLHAQVTSSASAIRTLSPVLLLGGLAATIAVFCLLLVGSRAAPAPARADSAANESEHAGLDDYDD